MERLNTTSTRSTLPDADNRKIFVPVTEDDLRSALDALPETCVLVGGQALAYWMALYDVPFPGSGAVTIDADFLTESSDDGDIVIRIAKAIGGVSKVNPRHVMSALVGTVEKPVEGGRFISLDFIFKVFGMNENDVRERSHTIDFLGVAVRVMDPLDVLESRLRNLYKLEAKQTTNGVEQLRCAIEVVRQLQLREELPWDQHAELIEVIACFAREGAGRKVRKRFDVCVADAIVPPLSAPTAFYEKRWPQIVPLMSKQARQDVNAAD
jgi:hypothetical protein